MQYELINPSDKIFFEAEDLEVATVAVGLVGSGKYGAHPKGDGPVVPIFLFGGWVDFCTEHFGKEPDYKDFTLMSRVATCLRTFRVDGERTSMNDICGRAQDWANKIDIKFKGVV